MVIKATQGYSPISTSPKLDDGRTCMLFFHIPMASTKISWQLWIGPSSVTLNTFPTSFVSIQLWFVLVQFWIENVLSQLAVLAYCTWAISTKTTKFSYLLWSVLFHVTNAHTSWKDLSPQFVVACNLKPKNSCYIVVDFTKGGSVLLYNSCNTP